jgi:hypothetical protein
MKSAVLILAACLLFSGTLIADAVTLSSGASMTNFSSVFNPLQPSPQMNTGATLSYGTPFWNNYSTDTGVGGSHNMNIGYMLTGTGGFAGTNVLGSDSVATTALGGGTAMAPTDPTAFSFTPDSAETYDVTLLGGYSGVTNSLWYGTQFGIYYTNGSNIVYNQLYGPGANPYTDTASIDVSPLTNPLSSFGFYAIVCYAPSPVNGTCPSQYQEIYYTDSSMNSGYLTNDPAARFNGGGYNHFALFGLTSNPNANFVIAFKDGPVGEEGLGDFNDVVIAFTDPSDFPAGVPEPATLVFVGMGLIALGIGGKRFKKR